MASDDRPPAEWLTGELELYVGGLSKPSKMPGYAYSLPAAECKTGGRLQSVEGSTCHKCYALKGRYAFPNVKAAMYRRLDAISKPEWVPAMAELIRRRSEKIGYFRWHDSGDIQSVKHFSDICDIARQTPKISHWIPTREYRFVSDFVANGGDIPDNLNVRFSAHMLGGHVPTFPRLRGICTVSTVSPDPVAGTYECPSRFQDNQCGDCRACWNRSVPAVNYHLH